MTQSNVRPSILPAVVYIKYSSAMQYDDGSFNLEAYRKKIKALVAAERLEIVQICSDPTTSAHKNSYRSGSTKVLNDSRRGRFEILYVHKVSWLKRRPKRNY